MSIESKSIFHNIDFDLFSKNITETLHSAIEKYWEQDIEFSIQAVNDFRELRDEKYVQNTDFFTSQIRVENHKPVIIRLSKDFIHNFLTTTLSENFKQFELKKLTGLEIKILNNFSEFLYKRLKEVLISEKEVKITEKSEKKVNFLFILSQKGGLTSQIMISIPMDRLQIKELKQNVSFTDEDFRNSEATVRIKAGSSKITLDEIKNLSTDDIIVLEDSDCSKLTLVSGDVHQKFNVKVNQSLVLNINNDDGDNENNNETYDEVIMEKNLWDDIQIEINAEFEKVKMTIGELKQITKGQIVDLGSVFDNEISLFVEDKKVAKGELIIINDRYAVRLNEVLSAKKEATEVKPQVKTVAPPPKPQVKEQAKAGAKVQATNRQIPVKPPQQKPQVKPEVVEDEEFDYSDFEK